MALTLPTTYFEICMYLAVASKIPATGFGFTLYSYLAKPLCSGERAFHFGHCIFYAANYELDHIWKSLEYQSKLVSRGSMLEENIMEKVALLHGRDPLAWCILPGNSILVNCDTHTYFMKDPEVFGYYAEARTNFKVKSPQTEEVEKELRKRLIYLFDENREYKIVSLIDCRVVIIGK